MRCKACNCILEDWEGQYDPETKQHEELCSGCIGASNGIETMEDLFSEINFDVDDYGLPEED